MVIFHGKLLVYQRLVKVSGYLYQISLDDFIALVELIGDRDAKKIDLSPCCSVLFCMEKMDKGAISG